MLEGSRLKNKDVQKKPIKYLPLLAKVRHCLSFDVVESGFSVLLANQLENKTWVSSLVFEFEVLKITVIFILKKKVNICSNFKNIKMSKITYSSWKIYPG